MNLAVIGELLSALAILSLFEPVYAVLSLL
jgi:hypothetical protein